MRADRALSSTFSLKSGETKKRAPAAIALTASDPLRTVPAPTTARCPSRDTSSVMASRAFGVVRAISMLEMPPLTIASASGTASAGSGLRTMATRRSGAISSVTGSTPLLPALEQPLHLVQGGISLEVSRRCDGAGAAQIRSPQAFIWRETAKIRSQESGVEPIAGSDDVDDRGGPVAVMREAQSFDTRDCAVRTHLGHGDSGSECDRSIQSLVDVSDSKKVEELLLSPKDRLGLLDDRAKRLSRGLDTPELKPEVEIE